MGTEVPRVQLHECENTKAADRAESGDSLQRASPGADESDERCEHRADGRGTGPLICGAGSATSATAKHRACCKAVRNGPGADCDRRSGSSGSAGRNDLLNSANGEWARTWPLKRRAAPTVRGRWQTVRPLLSRCPTLTLPRWGFRL